MSTTLAACVALASLSALPLRLPLERASLGIGGAWYEPRSALSFAWRAPFAGQWQSDAEFTSRAACRYDFSSGRCTGPAWSFSPSLAWRVAWIAPRISLCLGACRAQAFSAATLGRSFSLVSLSERPLGLSLSWRVLPRWQITFAVQRPRDARDTRPVDAWRDESEAPKQRSRVVLGFRMNTSANIRVGDGASYASARLASQQHAQGAGQRRQHPAWTSGAAMGFENKRGGAGVSVSRFANKTTARVFARLVFSPHHALLPYVEGPRLPGGGGVHYSAPLVGTLRLRAVVRLSAHRLARSGRVSVALTPGAPFSISVHVAWAKGRSAMWRPVAFAALGPFAAGGGVSFRGGAPQASTGVLTWHIGGRRRAQLSLSVRWLRPPKEPHAPSGGPLDVWLRFAVQTSSGALSALLPCESRKETANSSVC